MSNLFGEEARRVTTEEMKAVHQELKAKVGGLVCDFQLTFTLEEKPDHGDVDILVLTHPEQDVFKVIETLEPIKYKRNGHCHSFLYKSQFGNVHVDFLVSSDPNLHRTKTQYYAFNNLSAVIGMVAKSLNFKYGTDGFFKRYKDKRGNWHDILISVDLNSGLECLGYTPKPLWIKNYKDIVDYTSSSLMFSSEIFSSKDKEIGFSPSCLEEEMEWSRTYVLGKQLFGLGIKSGIEDSDHFFKLKYPEKYTEVQLVIKEIEDRAYRQSRFNGNWLIENFGLKPGKEIGVLLKKISDKFGEALIYVDDETVMCFVNEILCVKNKGV